jgi:hypothetical protein
VDLGALAPDDKQHSLRRLPRRALCSRCSTGRLAPGHVLGAPDLAKVAALRACSGRCLGSGWAAVRYFDPARPSRIPLLRSKTRLFAGTSRVEPTGIEPVTSCLQSETADVRERPDSLGIEGEPAFPAASRYGWIRRD